jgi:hypothetical protein
MIALTLARGARGPKNPTRANPLDCAEQAHRQEDDGSHEFERAMNGYSSEAEWQQEQPNQRIKHRSNQGEWPANYQ